jgi:hypothetical protein
MGWDRAIVRSVCIPTHTTRSIPGRWPSYRGDHCKNPIGSAVLQLLTENSVPYRCYPRWKALELARRLTKPDSAVGSCVKNYRICTICTYWRVLGPRDARECGWKVARGCAVGEEEVVV